MYYYIMAFKLNDTVHDVQDDHPLQNIFQNGITKAIAIPNKFYHTSSQIQTPFNCYFDIYSDKWMYYYIMVFKSNDTVPDVQDDHPVSTRILGVCLGLQ